MIKKVLAIILAFLYSIVYIVVGPIIKTRNLSFDSSDVLSFVLCFVICLAINIFLFWAIPKCKFNIKIKRIDRCIDKLGDRKLFFIIWIFIFISWIPAYLIFYPGILAYDMISQVNNALGEIATNHHPVLHTWLIRIFMRLGDNLFSEYEYGIGLLSILQMVMLSYALSRLVMLLKKKNVPILIVILTAMFSAIWFMNACLSVTMIKDTLFAAFFVLFACHFTEIVLNPVEYSKQKKNLIILPIISFLMCALRNNGIHIYVFCFAVLLVLRISQIKKTKMFIALIVAIMLPIFIYKIYTGPVFEACGIRQGEVREALCIPIQQLQYVAIDKADELTNEQMELMNYYIDNLEWREWSPHRDYNPFFADPAKSCFYSDNYNNDPLAFWKYYLQLGKQYPKEYIVAFLSNTLGYWYPGYYEYSYVVYENYSPDEFIEPLERKSIGELPMIEEYYKSVCASEFWRETPILRLFFVPGFSIWILIYALILAWKKKEDLRKVVPIFLPLIAQYGIMLLSPMSSFRYSWPFYLLLPISFVGIFGSAKSNSIKEESVKETLENKNDVANI